MMSDSKRRAVVIIKVNKKIETMTNTDKAGPDVNIYLEMEQNKLSLGVLAALCSIYLFNL